MTGAWAHVGVGIAILVAVIARLALRWRFAAPGHAPDASALQVAKDGLLDDLKKALSDGF